MTTIRADPPNIDPVEEINTIEKYLTEFSPHILPEERKIILDLIYLQACSTSIDRSVRRHMLGT